MLKNYLKVAMRNILRNRVYSAINIFGLAIAITLCLLIILFVIDQRSMDRHMVDLERTYRILSKHDFSQSGKLRKHATASYQTLELIRSNHPEIEVATRLKRQPAEIRFDDRIFNFTGLYAEANFLTFFNFPLVQGDNNALVNPNSIVLEVELAEKLFPEEDPLGKQVELKDLGSFLVTGIVGDLKSRTHLEFDALMSFSSFDQQKNATSLKENWLSGMDHFYHYFKVDQQRIAGIQTSLDGMISLLPEAHRDDYSFHLQRLDQVSLGEVVHNELGFVTPFFIPWFLGVLAAVVMLSATFNYVGLAIALAIKRSREVGIRKIVGAARRQVFIQFLIEAQVTVLFSWVLSIALLGFVVPAYNELKVLRDINGMITIDLVEDFYLYFIFLAFAVIIGLIAGGYPAWYVGRMSFSKALGKRESRSPSFLVRKSLVLVQYATSVVFIITAIVLYRQAIHFYEMDYGFDQSNLINVPLKEIPYQAIKAELLRDNHIEGVSLTSALPGLKFVEKTEVFIAGKTESIEVANFAVNEDFLQNFKIDLIAGRNFNSLLRSDQKALLINQQAAEGLGIGLADPDIAVKLAGDEETRRVIGVVPEFKYNFLFRESGPLVLTYVTAGDRFLNIRYAQWDEQTAAVKIEEIWRQFNKLHPFEYTHYEYELSDIYDEFMDIARIVGIVAILAILIACLGQFGMILHHVQLRVKEVGIRKALGANLAQLTYLLSRGYFQLILLSVVIGTPLGWWINDLWTNKIAYSIEVNWWTIIIGLVLVFGLAVISIISLTWKTANANPVESLRYE